MRFTDRRFSGTVTATGFRLSLAATERSIGFANPVAVGVFTPTNAGTTVSVTRGRHFMPLILGWVFLVLGLLALLLGCLHTIRMRDISTFPWVAVVFAGGFLMGWLFLQSLDSFASPGDWSKLAKDIRLVLDVDAHS